MTEPFLTITTIHDVFSRDDRRYCLFSVNGRDEDFLYYSHVSRPLRSLMFGKDFREHIPVLISEKKDLCIECGLCLNVAGGVALDNGDLIAWNCSVKETNRILEGLRRIMGANGDWIVPF